MRRFFIVLLIAGSSFYMGWWTNGRFLPVTATQTVSSPTVHKADKGGVVPARVQDRVLASSNGPAHSLQSFRQLLALQDFEEAMRAFEQVMEADEALAQAMRLDVIVYLQKALEQERNAALMALVDAYLARYYDDIDVLMVLAEYQRRQGYFDEAARVFQLALTYAYQPAQQDKVSAALLTLVGKTDTLLSEQQRWVELLGFYQLLNSIDLSQPRFFLRQAIVYLKLQDLDSARELLLPLTGDAQWGGKAEVLLATIDAQSVEASDINAEVNAIPLLRRGHHYLVKVQLNDLSDITLMIDTGASVTSLSRNSFSRLSQHQGFTELGVRLFNTANGIAKGDVYRVDTFSLGDHIVSDINIAVLDFNQEQGIDGLLGMNVLQYFRFEIDQDKQLLLLQAR